MAQGKARRRWDPKQLSSEFGRYFLVGSFAFACDFTVLFACTEYLHIHYLISNLIGYACGFWITYFLNVAWVFSERKYDKRLPELSIFSTIAAAGVMLNELIMFAVVEGIGISYLVAKVFAAGAVFLFNFMARKHFLFTNPDGGSGQR